MKRLVIGILAHVDSGKTTLSEALLYLCGAIKKLGRVDNGDTALDTDDIERKRGITVFSKQATFSYKDTQICLLDTPGHVDFSTEMERTLSVLDYSILVINGVDGLQSHSLTLWKLLEKYNIPTFIFINKMDLATANKEKTFSEVCDKLSDKCVDFSLQEEDFFEKLALCDDELLNSFVTKGLMTTDDISREIKNRKIFPCFFGSALKTEGIEYFLNQLDKYILAQKSQTNFGAKIFKISRDENDNRLTFMKITGGELKVKALLHGKDKTGKDWAEKPNQIRLYTGDKFITSPQAAAGQVCAVTGLNYTFPGEGLGACEDNTEVLTQPVFCYSVKVSDEAQLHKTLSALRILEEEDPQLNVSWDEHQGAISLRLMGKIQLEIIQNLLKNRFNLSVEFEKGRILYKETIEGKVEGVGHFEPLRHYSEVHLIMESATRGSGLTFASSCSEDVLDKSWQRLILTHLEEKIHKGILTSSPITDMKITLATGKASIKHTEGGDFRQATYRAVRQGLMKAKNILLEPWYSFVITVPTENIGRTMSDIQKIQGEFDLPQADGEFSSITGSGPVVLLADYYDEIISYTKGCGKISLVLDGYRPCHNTAQVIQEIDYDCEADLDNTADSVFCSHGAGFNVKWNEVPLYMHLESVLKPEKKPVETVNFNRARQYAKTLEQDGELLKIFEQTYGKIRRDAYSALYTKSDKSENSNTSGQAEDTQEEFLLVDGYNIIFAWEDLKTIAKDNIDAARTKLINIMCNYQGFKKCQVILVFDAYKVKGNTGSIEKYHNITLVYTKEAETADMYIEKVTKSLAKNYKVRVATSDGLEQMIILGHGALRLSASAFQEEVQLVEKAIKQFLTEN